MPFSLSDSEAALAFNDKFGSIEQALNAGVLPSQYFETSEPVRGEQLDNATITQLLPVQESTYFLIGDVFDNRYVSDRRPPSEVDDDIDEMLPMSSWIQEPALVRRVECYALMEAGYIGQPTKKPKRWIEPVLHLTTEDQQSLMNLSAGATLDRHGSLSQCNTFGALSSGAERTLPASRYLQIMTDAGFSDGRFNLFPRSITYDTVNLGEDGADLVIGAHNLWTHLMVTDSPPTECGFSRRW
jgi:hypothetical protein